MTDLTPALLSALHGLNACSAAAFAREEMPLPLLTVEEENISVYAQADGRPYLEEHILAVDAWAPTREEAVTIGKNAHDALTEALGLRLISARDAFDESLWAWRRQMRFRALVHQDTIYQP